MGCCTFVVRDHIALHHGGALMKAAKSSTATTVVRGGPQTGGRLARLVAFCEPPTEGQSC